MSAPRCFHAARGLIFDLDGTLVDSYEAIGESLNHALRSLGLESVEPARIRTLVGRGLESLIERAMGGAAVEDPDRIPAGVRLFLERYDVICIDKTRLLPDVAETLHVLHERGMTMAVATNKPSYFAKRILDALEVGPFLRAVFGPDLVPRPKPHPDMLAAVLSAVSLRPSETVYIGDMEVDVETARAAGVPVIVLPTGSCDADQLRASGADLVLPGFRSLQDLFPGPAGGARAR